MGDQPGAGMQAAGRMAPGVAGAIAGGGAYAPGISQSPYAPRSVGTIGPC